jgi:hypothetical protein
MTPEKRAELLHYAADHPDAMFMSKKFTAKVGYKLASFEMMIKWHGYDDWEIYHEPKDEVRYGLVRSHLFFDSLEEVNEYIATCNLTDLLIIKHTVPPNGKVKVEVLE